ncbi:MAG: Xaa-Pro peptidase family protein [Pseudomonadota bacterium]
MDERSLIFPAAEFQARVTRLQHEMAQSGLDLILLTSPADIFYISGFLTRFWESPARPWFVLVPATGAPVAVIPTIGVPLMAQSWLPEIHAWDAPDPRDDGVSLLTDTLASLVPDTGQIGLPMGPETSLRMPLADYTRLAAALAPRRLVDATHAIQRTREIKSPAEIEKLRRVCAIAGASFAALEEIVAVGRPLASVFRDFQKLLLQNGADWVSYLAGAAGRDGYLDVIAPASEVPLAAGDVMMLDTGAVKDGYFCDFDRNVFIGAPSDAARRVDAALWDATEDALAQLRPGMLACDAHRILFDGLLARGVQPCGGRLGHGLGLTLTEWPSFTALDQTELRAGMALTLEPSAFIAGERFLVHEENIVLRADGPELLAPRAPRGPREIAI